MEIKIFVILNFLQRVVDASVAVSVTAVLKKLLNEDTLLLRDVCDFRHHSSKQIKYSK